MTAVRARAFPGRDEALNLLFPLLALAMMGVLYAAGFSFADVSNRRALDFLQSVIFLNAVHTAFAFHLLYDLPEMREMTRRRPGFFGLNIWIECLIVGAAWYVFFFWVLRRIPPPLFFPAVPGTLLAIELHHIVKQTLGLSVLYNENLARSGTLSEDQARTLGRAALFEKAAFGVLLAALVAIGYLRWMKDFAWQGAALKTAFALSGLAIAAVLFNTVRFPGGGLANKFRYQLRCLYFPFAPVSVAGTFLMTSVHGLENLWVYRRMRANSRGAGGAARKTVFFAGCLGVAAFSILRDEGTRGFGGLVSPYAGDFAPWLPAVGALSPTIAFTHYYLDRWLFRMRDPRCREAVGPLLTGR